MLPARSSLNRLLPRAEVSGFVAAVAALALYEIARHPEYLSQPSSLIGFLPDLESTWLGLAAWLGEWTESQLRSVLWAAWPTWSGMALVAAAPLWWLGKQRNTYDVEAAGQTFASDSPRRRGSVVLWILSPGLFALHVLTTMLVARHFQGMPPAYHDEYSYLFQAKTFLAGRLCFPADERSAFFTQMHVLNDNGVFASRYFPGVGLWLAPWVAIGRAYWGQYLAGGLIVVLVLWIGYELPRFGSAENSEEAQRRGDNGTIVTGIVAALLCALSPALLLFGNLLLSHHPTALGLVGFVFCYLRALRSESIGWPLAGGSALCLAMTCRPLTAFGFAFPFAAHLACRIWRGTLNRCVPRVAAALTPILLGIAALAFYNFKLTGNPMLTPYGLYTQIYTPNHVYGFYNVTRGQKHAGPKVLENYNNWAEDLTPGRAIRLLAERADASATWSIGRLSIAWLAGVLLVIGWRLPTEWKLLAAAIVSLHAAYFAFGFEGIFGLSYVFESVPLLCLLAAGTGMWLLRMWLAQGRWGRVIWLFVLLCFNLNDPALRLGKGISEVRFARRYYDGFERRMYQSGVQPCALVFIRPDPADRHRDLITNSPTLDDPILRARAGDTSQMTNLMRLYRDRHFWLFDARSEVLMPLEYR